jgi:hypothetical protein
MLGLSVKTEDEEVFRKNYLSSHGQALRRHGIRREKAVYKAAHLTKQALERTPLIIAEFLEEMSPSVTRIDVYCAYYNREFISVFGQARGRRLSPLQFISMVSPSFPHVCAMKYLMTYRAPDVIYQLDHFAGKTTPAWRGLTMADAAMEIFYSGDQCNALISTADLVLRLIDTYQYGTVNGRSLLKPIEEKCPSLTEKLRFHNMGGRVDDLRMTAPDLPIEVNLNGHLKRPILFVQWTPSLRRKDVKTRFEWSPVYNGIVNRAFREKGGVKFVDEDRDFLLWDAEEDYIVAVTKKDEEKVRNYSEMGYELPRMLGRKDLL